MITLGFLRERYFIELLEKSYWPFQIQNLFYDQFSEYRVPELASDWTAIPPEAVFLVAQQGCKRELADLVSHHCASSIAVWAIVRKGRLT